MLEQNLENISGVILACCVLHNICQDENEILNDEEQAFLAQVIAEEHENANRGGRNNKNFCNDCLYTILAKYEQYNINQTITI